MVARMAPSRKRGWLPILGEASFYRTGGEGLQDQDLDRQRLFESRRRKELKRKAEEAFQLELARQRLVVNQRWRGLPVGHGQGDDQDMEPDSQGARPPQATEEVADWG